MKKTLYILLFVYSTILPQTAGNSGLSFLKIGFGARNLGMSDLGVVGANDVTALNYNPALLINSSNAQILVSHNEWIQDLRSELFGATFTMFDLPFAVGINTTTISDIEVRTRPGEVESTFNAHFFFGSISTGFRVFDRLSSGFTIKYLYENLLTDESAGMAFDIGLFYEKLLNTVDVGLSLRNIGSLSKLRNEATELPLDLRAGILYDFDLVDLKSKVTLIGGLQTYTKTDDYHSHFGFEIFYDNLVSLRSGYVTGYDSKNLSFGFGLLWKRLNFDYAFTPFDYDLGNSHTLSIIYSF
ncbi:PorV/PorQ family protein [Bacteroidota bacterium]